MYKIGKNIKHFRTAKHMTQDDLAAKLSFTRQTISNYETEKSQPSIETLRQMAEVMEVDINKLIYGKDYEVPSENEKAWIMTKKDKVRLFILTLIAAVCMAVTVFMGRWSLEIKETYFIEPFMLYIFAVRPACFTLAGFWAARVLQAALKARIYKSSYIILGKRIAAVLMICFTLFMLPIIIVCAAVTVKMFLVSPMEMFEAEYKYLMAVNEFYKYFPRLYSSMMHFIPDFSYVFMIPGFIFGLRTSRRLRQRDKVMNKAGENIRYFRTVRNMTQNELAEKIAVTHQTVSNYENGRSLPDVEILTVISKVLETDINKLIYGKDYGAEGYYLNMQKKKRKCIILAIASAACFITASRLYFFTVTILGAYRFADAAVFMSTWILPALGVIFGGVAVYELSFPTKTGVVSHQSGKTAEKSGKTN